MKIANYDEIQVDDEAEVTHTVTEEDIEAFGELSGDYNPLHFDDEWASKTMFKGRIAHGMLTASFISTVIGMKLPGTGTVYLSQEMKFKRPVRIGDTIIARVKVAEKNDERHHISLLTECTNQDGKVVLEGNAVVTLMRF